MDKNSIKKYAVWARRELIEKVSQRAVRYGISPDPDTPMDAHAVAHDGVLFTNTEKKQRRALIAQIAKRGYNQVIEEVAYTWFNRFAALRFMEVNGYLPSHIRVFTNEQGEFKPQILSEALYIDLPGLNKETVYTLKSENKDEELYRYLLVTQCNALSAILPKMFQPIEDYTELLLPDYLLREGSVIEQMISLIPSEDWTEQVQIIGWLYQYYNSEPKDEVFARLKNNVKITKENIPAATQLFTPDWIVRYMVENSLGRLVVSGQCSVDSPRAEALKANWKYYLDEAPQEDEVKAELDKIRSQRKNLNPEDIRCIDPCCGSGHILCYMFDVLMEIYTEGGYTSRQAVEKIIEKNLWGLDIDERAAQLSYFAVMMKARQYDKRFFARTDESGNIPQPRVFCIQQSNSVVSDQWSVISGQQAVVSEQRAEATRQLNIMLDALIDAEEYGSIIKMPELDWELLRDYVNSINTHGQIDFGDINFAQVDFGGNVEGRISKLLSLIDVAQALGQKYDVVVTNPPYMGAGGMNSKLSEYIKTNYADSKSDLFAVFIEKGNSMLKPNGYNCMVTMQSWMFLSSFEKMRVKALNTMTITNLMHMENMVLGIAFGTAVTIFENVHIKGYKGTYNQIKLQDIENEKPKEFPVKANRFSQVSTDNFSKIPGSPVAYWVSEKMMSAFEKGTPLGEIADSKQGIATADNNRFLREWYEVNINRVKFDAVSHEDALQSGKKWFPYNKGGEFRRWYGNNDFVVNWENDGLEIKNIKDSNGKLRSRPQNLDYCFRESGSWSLVSSGVSAYRYKPVGHLFDVAGMSFFSNNHLKYLIGLCNSKISLEVLKIIAPTINYQCGDIAAIPVILPTDHCLLTTVDTLVSDNISLSRSDWDSFETSWDFRRHPLLPENGETSLSSSFDRWAQECDMRFNQLKANEEELNRIFIDIYGLNDELSPEEEDKDVTVRKADLKRDIKSLISYAVGCMFGRYSLDKPGLIFAGGEFSDQWAAVSGQYFLRKDVEYCAGKELSRSIGMAEVNVGSGGDISLGETSSERGVIFAFGSDEEIGSVDSIKYSRGASKKLYEGICKLPVDSKGVNGGTGDPVYDLCSPEILRAISSGKCDELVQRGWEDAKRVNWEVIRQNITTDHCPLTTDHFSPDGDNVVPITDDNYFDDDIVGRFVNFIEVVYGKESLEENLRFIADALGGSGTARDVIRNYFLNDFFADHCKVYQKRPIYWLFDSGKKNGFKCLIYMHRYKPDTLARIRTDYIHEQQSRYRTAIADTEQQLERATGSQRVSLNKKLTALRAQSDEILVFEEKVHHLADQMIDIDLDDGVKHNYEIFKDVLAKIK